MHILATFATLCCQTRWPRNHSCTTQEHVSFFRTFSGTRQKPTGQNRTFSEISTFSTFDEKPQKVKKLCAHVKNIKIYVRACSQKEFTNCTCSKNKFCVQTLHKCANVQMCKCANLQMCEKPSCTKCANLQRKYFSKCRNHKSANAQFCTNANFAHVTIFLCKFL